LYTGRAVAVATAFAQIANRRSSMPMTTLTIWPLDVITPDTCLEHG
jgi:hypothetical protein